MRRDGAAHVPGKGLSAEDRGGGFEAPVMRRNGSKPVRNIIKESNIMMTINHTIDWEFHFATVEKVIHGRTPSGDRLRARISFDLIRRALRDSLVALNPDAEEVRDFHRVALAVGAGNNADLERVRQALRDSIVAQRD